MQGTFANADVECFDRRNSANFWYTLLWHTATVRLLETDIL